MADFTRLLSDRQHKILELIANNYSNKKIGETLYISESTVKSEISIIIKKLNANGRVQASIIAYKKRLITI